MSQKLVQNQNITQTQQLTPQQLQLIKLLELPLADLEARIKDELMENAALEENAADRDDEQQDENTNDTENYEESGHDERQDYFSDDDVPDYVLDRAAAEEEKRERIFNEGTSFYESLKNQIGEQELTPKQEQLVEYLIGSLDDDGLLRKDLSILADELVIYHNIETTPQELEEALKILQTFDPRGIGARNLQECLHLQLADPEIQNKPWRKEALRVVDTMFDDFKRKRWDNIAHRLGVSADDFQYILYVLVHLNPRPGFSLNESSTNGAQQVMPDFSVHADGEGGFDIRLNEDDVPTLHVSRSFQQSIKQYQTQRNSLTRQQRDAYVYARQKVDAAQSFIDALQRRHETLMAVMETIVDMQRDFFADGDEQSLRPMILNDVAQRVGINISTVSRTVNSKYVETDYGIYPLKFFFSTAFSTADGEEQAARKVKIALRRLIDDEDKQHPLSDEALAAALKEQGINVARRTVAKYREQLGLPVARLRR